MNAYAGHDCNRPSLSLQTNVALAPWEQEMALTPIEMDLGALEVIASLPETACPARKQSVARASLRKSVYRPGSRSSVVAVELPGGSLITVITPEQSAWQRAPYVPGAIRLEPKIRTERSPLAIIQEAVDAELGLDKEKVAAEQAIIDELVSFVGSFGDDFKVEETGIDAFWVDLPPPRSPVQNNWDFLSPLSIASTLVQSPPAAGALRLSKCGSNALEESFDRSGDLNEPEIIRDPPSASLRRASFASSNHSGSSRTIVSTQSSISTHSPPQTKHPYSSAHSLQSLGYASFGVPMSAMSTSSPRKVRQVKGKGVTSSGQKTSFRGLIRSAASIV